jgi:hypothetical protein
MLHRSGWNTEAAICGIIWAVWSPAHPSRVEASCGWYLFYARAGGGRNKTDPIDARGLAILLRNGALPEVWVPQGLARTDANSVGAPVPYYLREEPDWCRDSSLWDLERDPAGDLTRMGTAVGELEARNRERIDCIG